MGICQGGRFVKIACNLYEYPLDKGTARYTLVVGGQEVGRSPPALPPCHVANVPEGWGLGQSPKK